MQREQPRPGREDPNSDGDSRDSLSDVSDSSHAHNQMSLHVVSKPEQLLARNGDLHPNNDLDLSSSRSYSPEGHGDALGPPRSKKQRILQSVTSELRDVTDSDDNDYDAAHHSPLATTNATNNNGFPSNNHHYMNNNHIMMTKPSQGLLPPSSGGGVTLNGGLLQPLHRKSMDNVLRRLSSTNNNNKGGGSVAKGVTSQGDDVTDDDVMGTVQAALHTAESVEDKERKLAEMIAHLQNIKDNLSTQKKASGVSKKILVYTPNAGNTGK